VRVTVGDFFSGVIEQFVCDFEKFAVNYCDAYENLGTKTFADFFVKVRECLSCVCEVFTATIALDPEHDFGHYNSLPTNSHGRGLKSGHF